MTRTHQQSGFSLIELIVAMGVLLAVSSIVTSALLQMTQAQTTVWNRTEMHSGIRGATELLQQEVGQAGRITLPGTVTLAVPVAATVGCNPEFPLTGAVTVGVNTTATAAGVTAVSGMWATPGPPASYITLTTLDGDSQESFRVAEIDGTTTPATIKACFTKAHPAGTVLVPMGGFATGIIPNSGFPEGSSDNVLKMYGDINGDGKMVYVEYTCDFASGNLYRKVMKLYTDPPEAKTAVTADDILLSNIQPNPEDPLTMVSPPCFTYQKTVPPLTVQGTQFTFILDVAITLTVETEQIDPVTRQYQRETKALLNVSPRNVFSAWSLASIGYTDRIQSTPASVTSLLAPLP